MLVVQPAVASGQIGKKNLGLNVSRARLLISAVAVLLAAVSTAIGGLIAFVGLLVPHIARLLVGSDHRFSFRSPPLQERCLF